MWLRPLAPGERRNYDAATLDLVAEGLGISRRALGIAAMKDAGQVLAGSDDETLDAVYQYLADRDDDEQAQILAWLAARIAERRAERQASSDDERPGGAVDRAAGTAQRRRQSFGAVGA